ncbi:muscular protein 20 [Chrysochromulina tobinii]|uniref:Muscular protein 20 n=1 Tax=Chrysochromulina tobinii TaxID=1460289 RepID=A0A0M0J860_9EUKA|nr:muscular protein 20 [Chrysochromulina tobinii]|eukprot:KOO22779.1 muscular protein 20 [Chrysochromulina sp. CCMP291]
MRRRQEQALTALRQKSFRDARQAQAQHEYAIAQLRRQSEEQLGAAAEARRAEAKRVDGLAQKLGEVQARLRRLEAQQPLAVVGGSSARWSGESVDVKGASAGDVPGLEGELAAELRAMAHSHRIELGAKEKAAAAVLEREVAHRERALASLEAGFAEERAELEGRSTKLGARVKELEAQQQKALEAFKSRAEVAERALEAERSERRALEENFSAAQRQWKAGQAEEAQRRQREDDALVDDVMTRRRQEMLAEARKQARSELWEEARRSAKEELEGARLELEAEMLARRSLYRENEEARAAAEARTEAAEAAASRAKAAAREEGFAEGREAAWREARMIARLEMEEEMKRAGAEQAVAAEVKLRELEQARTQVHLQLAEAERAMSIAVQDAREEAIAQTRAKAYEEAREQVQAEWAGQQGGAQQGWPSAEGAGVGGAGMEPSSPSAPATPEGSHAGGLTGPAPSPGPSPGFGSSRMLDAVSRLAESEQRAWVSEVERTVQQRQMLSKAQEVSQAIGAEMRRAREAIIAEYGPEPTPDTEPLDAPLSSGVGEVQSAAPPPAAEDPYGYATTRAAAEAVFADGYAEAEGGASGDAVPGVSDGLAGLGEPPSELPPVPVVKPRLPPPPPQVVAARGEFPAPGFFCAPASDAPYAATAPLTPAAASALAAPPSPPLPEQSPSQKVSDSPPGSSAAPTGSSAAPTGSSAALTGSSAAPSGSSAAPTGSSAAPSGSSAAPKPGSSGPTAATRPAAQKPSPKQSKPDGGLRAAIEAGAWMAEVLGIAPPPEAADVEGHHALLHAWLRSGELLCELINKLQPGTISRVSSSAMPFKQMENISNYIEACAALGVPNQDCFRSVDLFEGKDLRAVVRNIHSLGRVAQRLEGFHGPTLGAKLAEKNERSFTEQQLSEAKAMPARWSNVGKSMPSADAPVQPRPQAAGMRRGP